MLDAAGTTAAVSVVDTEAVDRVFSALAGWGTQVRNARIHIRDVAQTSAEVALQDCHNSSCSRPKHETFCFRRSRHLPSGRSRAEPLQTLRCKTPLL